VPLNFLRQRVYGTSLRVTDNMPVLLQCSAGIPVTHLVLNYSERCAVFQQFACGGMAKCVKSRAFDSPIARTL
jgi:hypothetical protein